MFFLQMQVRPASREPSFEKDQTSKKRKTVQKAVLPLRSVDSNMEGIGPTPSSGVLRTGLPRPKEEFASNICIFLGCLAAPRTIEDLRDGLSELFQRVTGPGNRHLWDAFLSAGFAGTDLQNVRRIVAISVMKKHVSRCRKT